DGAAVVDGNVACGRKGADAVGVAVVGTGVGVPRAGDEHVARARDGVDADAERITVAGHAAGVVDIHVLEGRVRVDAGAAGRGRADVDVAAVIDVGVAGAG